MVPYLIRIMKFLWLLISLLLLFVGCAEPDKQNETKPAEVDFAELEMRGDQFNPVAFYQGEPFKGIAVIYSKDGSKYTEQNYEDGEKKGEWRVYFPNGQIQKEGVKINGKDHGQYREWYQNGNLKYEYQYDLGKKVGKWLSWYEDGTKYTERNFVDDQLNGKVFVWDESGKLAKEYDYRNNRQVNAIMHFKENEN